MRIYACLTTLAAVATLSQSATGASAPVITLRVVNEGGVDRQPLLAAKREAAAILEHSGIRLVWLSCESGRAEWGSSNPCQGNRGPSEFWLRIVTRRQANASAEMLGFTEIDEIQGSAAAGIYYPAVQELAGHWSVPAGAILAAAIAHEVGHLLLGANAHSHTGVMSAHWAHEQFEQIGIGELLFTADQSKALRERIRLGEVSAPVLDLFAHSAGRK